MKNLSNPADTSGFKIMGSGLHWQISEEIRMATQDIALRNNFTTTGVCVRPTGMSSGVMVYEAPTYEISGGIFYIREAVLLLETATALWLQSKVKKVADVLTLPVWIHGLILDQNAKIDLGALSLADGLYSIFAEHNINYLYPFPATFQTGTSNLNFSGGDLSRVYEAGMRVMFGGNTYLIQTVDTVNNRLVFTATHGLTDSGVFVEIGGSFSPNGAQPSTPTHYRFLEMNGVTLTVSAGSVGITGRKIKLCEVTKTGGSYVITTPSSTTMTIARAQMGYGLETYLSSYIRDQDTDKNNHKIVNLTPGASGMDAVNYNQLALKMQKDLVGETSTDPRAGTGSTPGAALTVNRTGVSGTPPDVFLEIKDHGTVKAQLRYDGKMVIQPGASGNDAVNFNQLSGLDESMVEALLTKISLAGAETVTGVKSFTGGLRVGSASNYLISEIDYDLISDSPLIEGSAGGPTVDYRLGNYGQKMVIGPLVIYSFGVFWNSTSFTGDLSVILPFIAIGSIDCRVTLYDPTFTGIGVTKRAELQTSTNKLTMKAEGSAAGVDITAYRGVTGTIICFKN